VPLRPSSTSPAAEAAFAPSIARTAGRTAQVTQAATASAFAPESAASRENMRLSPSLGSSFFQAAEGSLNDSVPACA
jgi:hypothetical protein